MKYLSILVLLALGFQGCVTRKEMRREIAATVANVQFSKIEISAGDLEDRISALERDHRIRSGLEEARERKRDEEAYIKEKCAELTEESVKRIWFVGTSTIDADNQQPSPAKPRDAEWTECIKSDTGTITNGHFVFPCLIELIGLTDGNLIWRKGEAKP